MNYTFEKAEKSTVKITINCDAKEWALAIDKAYQQTKGKYAVQGFRKGKAPKKILESVYGSNIFFEDGINNIFNDKYFEILEKEPSIEAVDRPEISVDKITDEGIIISAIVAVKPEIKLGNYKGIKFDKVEYNVKDEDVEAELKKLRERNSRLIDVEGRATIDGDTAVIDYSGSVDGVKFDGGTAENQNLVLGSNSFIPGFEAQVIGMTIGEEKDVLVKFPEEYQAKELAGKDAVFAVKLNAIKAKELPEINDEFIKEATGTESLVIFKEETKKKMEEEAKTKAEREIENKILKTISDASEVEIPKALVERQIENMVKDTEYKLMYQGLKLEDYLKYMGTDMVAFKKSYEKQAEEMVKSQLVIDKIIIEEKITAEENEINSKLEDMAKAASKTVEEYKSSMQERQAEYIENEIIVEKLFKFLKTNNEIV